VAVVVDILVMAVHNLVVDILLKAVHILVVDNQVEVSRILKAIKGILVAVHIP
jgi:hypothetical protein